MAINSFEVRTRGALSGASHVLDTLLSPLGGRNVDPRAYSFRMFCTLTTQDHRYIEHLNAGLWVASGIWKEDDMIIEYENLQLFLNFLFSWPCQENCAWLCS